MPLQNRVNPLGEININPSRGTLMGNRGILHDENKNLKSVSKIKGWVTCKLEFKDRKLELMAPNRYTELFFLDEATAFSAGHRPCAECRRDRYNEFKLKWLEANRELLDGQKESIGNIDKILHTERINKKEKVSYVAYMNELPSGTIFEDEKILYLVWNSELYEWNYEGYSVSNKSILSKEVRVLTPKSYVRMFKKGFVPFVHDSVKEASVSKY